ncbi:MAG: BatA domain-containing protein [Halobacteriales archaeon]|nr:BatA domain-containing protein [Halobacteriales archaeon]
MAGFSTPLGLLALGALVPLILLYILQPDPEKLRVPTMEFLPNIEDEGGTNPILEMLRRNLLLFLQILVLVLAAMALGSPFIDVTKSEVADETVVVLDATASMATEDGGATRFDSAVSYAADEVTGTTTVVIVGSSTNVVLEQGSASEARSTIETATVTDASGNLADGIARGVEVAGTDARLVVASDFAGASDWTTSVEQARARNIPVALRQFARGGEDNVGIVGTSFGGGEVTVEVANFGDEEVTRDVSLDGQTESVTLAPNDFGTVSFDVPAGTATVEISPGDSFPADDTAYVSGYPDSIDVLVVTSSEDRFLLAVLDSIPEVNYETAEPPVQAFDGTEYDAVVFDNVNADRLLDRTVRGARDAVNAGGGVVVVAQEDLSSIEDSYDDLLPVDVGEVAPGEGVNVVSDERFVRNVEFPAPRQYLGAELTDGRSLVESGSGDPLLATADVGNGRALYYGFMRGETEFHNSYQFPIFWRDALYHVTSRERLSSMNRQTGDRLSFAREATVGTPDGDVTGTSVVMDSAGFYDTGTVYSASLLDAAESNVSAVDVERTEAGETASRTLEETVPFDLTPYTAIAALVFVLAELVLMRYRGGL